jgi:hypothetical protein
MTRRLLLTLPAAADREHCGECPMRDLGVCEWPLGDVYIDLYHDSAGPLRHPACLAAEDAAEALRERVDSMRGYLENIAGHLWGGYDEAQEQAQRALAEDDEVMR